MTVLEACDRETSYAHVVSEDAVRELVRLTRIDLGTAILLIRRVEPRRTGLLELEGLGKEIWQGVDPRRYVRDLHDEWDARRAGPE